jgi:ribosomal protein L7/L12
MRHMGSDTDLLDHGQRIAKLEAQVAELTRRLGATAADARAEAQEASGFTFASDAPEEDAANDPRILELVAAGNKIGAIKLYRELTGTGLAEAKTAIEAL